RRAAALSVCGLILASLSAASCRPSPASPFRLVEFRQAGSESVRLNEPLVWFFDAPVDPASIQGGGIRVVEEAASGEGKPVAGRFEVVQERRVRFVPRLASEPDLSDGGFRPGRRYAVVLDGFPRASGVRSTRGQVLDRTVRLRFAAIPATASDRSPFEDRTPERGPFLTPERLSPGDPPTIIVDASGLVALESDEPIRPDTLESGAFTVRYVGNVGDSPGPSPVPPKLANREDGARIEIRLRVPLEPNTDALLEVSDRVTDLGGNPCEGPRTFHLIPDPESTRRLLVEDYGEELETEAAGAAVDTAGTATCAGDGRLTVHWPRAAGDGHDGERAVAASGALPARLEATHLVVAEGATLSGESAARLASQAALVVEGRVAVKGASAALAPDPEDGILAGYDLVLVAGGDLVVRGEIAADRAVLLAAGGAVHVTPDARIACERLVIVSPAAPNVAGQLPPRVETSRAPLPDGDRARLRVPALYRATSPWMRAGYDPMVLGAPEWRGSAAGSRVRLWLRGAPSFPSSPTRMDPTRVAPWTTRPSEVPPSEHFQLRVEVELVPGATDATATWPYVDRVEVPMHPVR
ncbi:MAG TPA: Ig-like domain-containing protein, partial [Planctomycetota bacterium]|nr:Ig-like domain-containing protein [Planctomycetota bacterium]